MNPYYPHLFEPLTIKRTTFRNRLFVAPHMMSHMDFSGRPDESMIDFFAEKARGGYAVVTLGDTPVDREHAATNPRSFAITPENQPKLAEIARAKHHIHIQYYIFCDDETGRRLRDALVEKVRQGVEVRILYDDVGCSGVKKDFFEGMRREGIEVFSFLHVKFPLFTSKVNYRNHRKIAVIDGRVGFIGGMNVADRYVRGTGWGSWRDTHFRIEGSGAAAHKTGNPPPLPLRRA